MKQQFKHIQSITGSRVQAWPVACFSQKDTILGFKLDDNWG